MHQIITASSVIESRLERFRDAIGEDFNGYRGHLYRVLNYTLFLLEGDETHRDLIETALVYHDIAVWTEPVMTYLEPSVELVLHHNKQLGWGYEPTLLADVIYWHHKILPFRGPNSDVVNAVRKGDWVDATGGRLRKGIPREMIEEAYVAIPTQGFYRVINGLGERFYPGDKWAAFRAMLRVIKL